MNWAQLQAILWLRSRLSWNRFVHAGPLNAVVGILITAMLLAGMVASGAGGFLAGFLVVSKQSPQTSLFIWDGVMFFFMIFWMAGLLAEIQRSESIDIAKLLHLPLSLHQVFVFNYIASHLTPAILLFLPGLLGLCLGSVLGLGLQMSLLIPLVLSFVFMLSAWTYCLRGWLAALMVNKRRRRAIVVWITLGFILIFQLPGMIINSTLWNQKRSPRMQAGRRQFNSEQNRNLLTDKLIVAHLFVPVGWPGYGAMTLRQEQPWPSVAATCLGCLLGSVGLMRSYRSTLRFYQGVEPGAKIGSSNVPKSEPRTRGVLLVERELPLAADDTAALALATLRSLLRAPELKMSLIMPIVMGAAMSSVPFSRIRQNATGPLLGFAATAAAFVSVFAFAPVMANAFGLDRNGFRGLVLLPTRRDRVLLAKNLAFFPFVLTVGIALLALAKFLIGVPWTAFFTGVVQVIMAFLLFSMMCNLVSVLTPYRMAPGTLQAKKPKPVVFLALGITMLGMPIVLSPVFIPPVVHLIFSMTLGLPAWLPINLLTALVILPGVIWIYWLVLPAQGRLLQRREQRILSEVTEEVE